MATKYKIVVKGHLDRNWEIWFGDMAVSYDDQDNTVLMGNILDNSAFFGFIDRLRDLNVTIISITEMNDEDE
jgi:hypothetical protein